MGKLVIFIGYVLVSQHYVSVMVPSERKGEP
jgi:hypothetical protein